MKPAPIPLDDDARLDALRAYDVLDTSPEQGFDDLVEVSAHIAGVPIALVSLVDRDRQWFKARFGLDATETPRDISFCGHVVADRSPLVVPDATKDPRFADNPLVEGPPDIRFYAGSPLVNPDGFHLGTLCVIDRRPRTLSAEQLDALAALSRQVVSQLELRRALAAERQVRAEAQAANVAKSAFLAKMSHELRTPLNAVIGFSKLLERNRAGTFEEKDLDMLQRIRRNGQHLLTLINEVLDLSRIESGRLSLERQPVPLDDLVDRVVADLEGALAARDVQLSITGVAGLVAPAADPLRLRQVLTNLLSNAARFAAGGRVAIRGVAGDEPYRPRRLDVIDDGVGVEEEKLGMIFDSFRQADDSTARTHGGSGLGLTIARSLCRAMGHDLVARSTVGRGSTFSIVFDGADPPAAHDPLPAKA